MGAGGPIRKDDPPAPSLLPLPAPVCTQRFRSSYGGPENTPLPRPCSEWGQEKGRSPRERALESHSLQKAAQLRLLVPAWHERQWLPTPSLLPGGLTAATGPTRPQILTVMLLDEQVPSQRQDNPLAYTLP